VWEACKWRVGSRALCVFPLQHSLACLCLLKPLALLHLNLGLLGATGTQLRGANRVVVVVVVVVSEGGGGGGGGKRVIHTPPASGDA